MLTQPVNFYQVTVVFNPLAVNPDPLGQSPFAVTLTCDDVIPGQSMNSLSLSIPSGISLIGFYILTLPGGSGEQALFDKPAVEWPVSSEVPECYLVQNWSFGHFSVVAFNTVRVRTSHNFSVKIRYAGRVFTGDPTIVNEPPMPLG